MLENRDKIFEMNMNQAKNRKNVFYKWEECIYTDEELRAWFNECIDEHVLVSTVTAITELLRIDPMLTEKSYQNL